MFEMTMVLVGSGILMTIAYEFAIMVTRREWGENKRSFF